MKVLASSVVRSSSKGSNHGGLYVVDTESGAVEQKVSRDDTGIDFSGRGGERGLRGLEVYDGSVFCAAANSIHEYDLDSWEKLGEYSCPALEDAHETDRLHSDIYVTSTSQNGVVLFNADACSFQGVLGVDEDLERTRFQSSMRVLPYGDEHHINSVQVVDGRGVFVAGTRMEYIYNISGNRAKRVEHIPKGTHNARIYDRGVCYNATTGEYTHVFGKDLDPTHDRTYEDIDDRIATANWLRGLEVVGGKAVIGCSPAQVVVMDVAEERVEDRIWISENVRNAIHGIKVLER